MTAIWVLDWPPVLDHELVRVRLAICTSQVQTQCPAPRARVEQVPNQTFVEAAAVVGVSLNLSADKIQRMYLACTLQTEVRAVLSEEALSGRAPCGCLRLFPRISAGVAEQGPLQRQCPQLGAERQLVVS